MPYHNDCAKYFICANGHMISHECASGMLFNPQTLKCDIPSRVRCDDTGTPPNSQMPLMPDCTGDIRFFPHMWNCNQYYTCVNNIPVLMTCPIGTLWNNRIRTCDGTDNNRICPRSYDPQNNKPKV